jgi:hypothetical protein
MLSEQYLFLENVYPGSSAKTSIVLAPPEAAPQQRVLAEALLENSTTRQRRSPLDWAVSLLIHLGVLSLLILVPFFFTQGIDMKRLETTLLVAPMPPMAPASHCAKGFHAGEIDRPDFYSQGRPRRNERCDASGNHDGG